MYRYSFNASIAFAEPTMLSVAQEFRAVEKNNGAFHLMYHRLSITVEPAYARLPPCAFAEACFSPIACKGPLILLRHGLNAHERRCIGFTFNHFQEQAHHTGRMASHCLYE